MAHTSAGYITAPVDVSDVRDVLEETSLDVGTLCSSGSVNKWSRCKPVRYPDVAVHTGGQFKGSPVDNNNGIYYGLQCATSAERWVDVHGSTYDYVGQPTGGTNEPFRLLDFNGYYHGATCTLSGSVPAVLYTSDNEITLSYISNSNCVDFDEIVEAMEGTGVTVDSMYPLILVSNYTGGTIGTSRVHALHDSDGDYVTLGSNSGSWHITLPSGYYSNGQSILVSICLCRTVSMSGVYDLTSEWYELTGEEQLMNDSVLGVPDCCGLVLTVGQSGIAYTATDIRLRTVGSQFMISTGVTPAPPSGTTVHVRIDITSFTDSLGEHSWSGTAEGSIEGGSSVQTFLGRFNPTGDVAVSGDITAAKGSITCYDTATPSTTTTVNFDTDNL